MMKRAGLSYVAVYKDRTVDVVEIALVAYIFVAFGTRAGVFLRAIVAKIGRDRRPAAGDEISPSYRIFLDFPGSDRKPDPEAYRYLL